MKSAISKAELDALLGQEVEVTYAVGITLDEAYTEIGRIQRPGWYPANDYELTTGEGCCLHLDISQILCARAVTPSEH